MKEGPAHFDPVADLCVTEEVRLHIDHTFTLEELPAALARVGEGRALGKVVVCPSYRDSNASGPGRLPRDPLIGLTAGIAAGSPWPALAAQELGSDGDAVVNRFSPGGGEPTPGRSLSRLTSGSVQYEYPVVTAPD